MAARTHYDTLGIARDASSVDIAAAFREKLEEMKSRPDAAPGKIEALREAYQALATPARRDEYDASLPPPPGARRRPPAARSEAPPAGELDEGFWHSKAARIGIPIVLVAVVAWGFGHRRKEPRPVATVVSVQALTPASPGGGTERAEPVAAGPAVVATAGGAPKSPEQLFAAVSPSVVRVLVGDAARPAKQGSGVVIEPARVITNCHVTSGGAKLTVKSGATLLDATVATGDEERDLCLLDVPGLAAPAVARGSVANLAVGQRVYAIGAPLGLELTLSDGLVSSLREAGDSKVIQTTAAVSPGSSGGGLFDAEGQLVGIVTFQSRSGQNLNFALPVDWLADLRNRSAPAAPHVAAAPAADLPLSQRVVGSWWCFGTISGRNGQYEYGNDGMVRITFTDGRPNLALPYRVVGSYIQFAIDGKALSLQVESATDQRMVLFVAEGQRLACERR